jgi:hypothetical protein
MVGPTKTTPTRHGDPNTHTHTHTHIYAQYAYTKHSLATKCPYTHIHIPKDISAPKQTHQLMHNYTYRVVTAMPISSTSSMALGDPQSKPQKERIVIPQKFEKFDFAWFFSHLTIWTCRCVLYMYQKHIADTASA